MNIPPKAVRPGSYHNVSIGLADTSQVDTEEGEFLAAHGIECIFPEQKTYSMERPITLSIPAHSGDSSVIGCSFRHYLETYAINWR